jgi:gliding motility-associated-like protein
MTLLPFALILLSKLAGSAGADGHNPAALPNCTFTVSAGPDITICSPGQTVSLNGIVNGPYLGAVWSPTTGLSNPNSPGTTATVNQTTTYTLTVTGLGTTNLVVNGNFNSGLLGFTSNYVPGTGGPFGLLSNEGTFAVSTNANLTHTNFANCPDHTGGGSMLVVNGAGTPNQNVWCQTVAVMPGTTYAFSAWGASVVSASPAILQISINGILLGAPFTLPAATCQWTQFFQTWNSGGATSAQICIVNQNTQPSGNDFALDDIEFGPVCTDMAEVTVTVVNVNATWTPPQNLCLLSPPFVLDGLLSPIATPGGQWTINGQPGNFFNPGALGPGTHNVSYIVGAPPCTQTNTQQIIINPVPSANWLNPLGLCVNSTPFSLNAQLLPGTPGNGVWLINGQPNAIFNPALLGAGVHTVTYTVGTPPCTSSLTQFIDVEPLPVVDWTAPPPICLTAATFALNSLLNPGSTQGGVWRINGAVASVFNPALLGPGTYNVSYTAGVAPCTAVLSQPITVQPLPVTAWNGPDTLCQSNPAVLLDTWLLPGSLQGGVWTINGQPASTLNPANLPAGTHNIVYTAGPVGCQNSTPGSIVIQAPPQITLTVSQDTICSGDTVVVSYSGAASPQAVWMWSAPGHTLSGQGPHSLSWTTSGSYPIALTVTDGICTAGPVQVEVFVEAPLVAPVPVCAVVTGSEIEIQWPAVAGADSIIVHVLTGQTPAVVTDTSALFQSLPPETTVQVVLQAISFGPCPDVWSDTLSCTTFICNVLPVAITPVDTICLFPASPVLPLQVLVNDPSNMGTGLWSGPGITNPVTGIFSPVSAGPGVHTIAYQYDLDNCISSDTIQIVVISRPVAAFATESPICVTDTSLVTFTGMAGPGAVFSWDFQDGTILSGSGAGPYSLTWPSAGVRLISLTIEEEGCGSLPFVNAVLVTPEVGIPEIFCNADLTEIEFFWNSLPPGFNTVVYVEQGPFGMITSDTSFLIPGLMPGEAVRIRVQVDSQSVCPGIEILVDCSALLCPTYSLSIDPPADTICLPATPITLTAQLAGAGTSGSLTWSGPGITDGQAGIWEPDESMAGTLAPIIATYTVGSCTIADTIYVPVFSTPTAVFSATTPVCQTDPVLVQYEGTGSGSAVFEWAFSGNPQITGAGAGPYQLLWDAPGSYLLELSVEENGCRSEPFTVEVQTDTALSLPEIICVSSYTTVNFSWNSIPGAAAFTTAILSGQSAAASTDTSLSVENLLPGDAVTLRVTALSAGVCPDTETTITCNALTCADILVQIAPVGPVCFDGTPETIQLSATLSGDPGTGSLIWSGPGITDAQAGLWQTDAGMAGQTVALIATYTDQVCSSADTVFIEVFLQPDASFTADSPICIADAANVTYTGSASAAATYSWDFAGGNALPGVGQGPHSVAFPQPGTYTLGLTVEENGCTSLPATVEVVVEPLLEMPVIQCEATYTSVVFFWSPGANVAQYEAQSLSGQTATAMTDTSISFSGLQPGESVSISVNALSGNSCPGLTADATCAALPCPNVSLSIPPIPQVCWDGQSDTLQLNVQVTGAPASGVLHWEGDGIIDAANGLWASRADMAGQSIQVRAVFTEDVCVYSDSASIAVFAVPDADFVMDSVICIADAATAQYANDAGSTAVFNWNFGGASAVPGTGSGPHTLTFPAAGSYTVTLSVEENGCVSETESRTVSVEPLLNAPMPVCSGDYTSVTFSWPAVPGANSYEIQVPAGMTPVWTSGTSATVSGLVPSTPVSAVVTAVSGGACPNTTASISCETTACPALSVSIQSPPVICAGDSATLVFTVSGPADTRLNISLSNGAQQWVFNNIANGTQVRILPSQTGTFTIQSVDNVTLPFCPLSLPQPFTITVERQPVAGDWAFPAAVCAFTDTLLPLGSLLSGADVGGVWSVISGSSVPFPGSFQALAGTFNPRQNNTGLFRFLYSLPAGAACPGDTTAVEVVLQPLPLANAGPDRSIDCINPVVSIGTGGSAGFLYRWTVVSGGNLMDDDLPIVEADMPGVYRLEVTDAATGCRAFDEVTVISAVSVLTPFVSEAQISCFGADDGLIRIDSITGGVPPILFSMNGGSLGTQVRFPNLGPGIYNLLIRDAAGCESELRFEMQQPVDIEAVINPLGLSSDNTLIRLGDSLWLELLVNLPPEEIGSIRWLPELCDGCTELRLAPTHTATYAVTVTNINGCSTTANLTVSVDRRPDVFVPNAFSPNNDGTNDLLLVFAGRQIAAVRSFLIFDRWGEAVFEVYNFPPNNPAYGWNGYHRGKLLSPAVFVYYAEVEMIDGTLHLIKGDVTLMR